MFLEMVADRPTTQFAYFFDRLIGNPSAHSNHIEQFMKKVRFVS